MAEITCFLIEDDEDDQEIFSMAINNLQMQIKCIFASDGTEALEKLVKSDPPDYIFLDLNMPRMNGRQFLIEIKKHDKLKSIPVVIYSTSSEERDRSETQTLGASAFITKPPYLSELIKTLDAFFSGIKK
jgi:CheY-like chemotaxis protein